MGALSFIAGCGLVLLNWLLSAALVNRLREHRTALFQELGSPTLFTFDQAPSSTMSFWSWVFSRRAHSEVGEILVLVWVLRLESALFLAWFLWSATVTLAS